MGHDARLTLSGQVGGTGVDGLTQSLVQNQTLQTCDLETSTSLIERIIYFGLLFVTHASRHAQCVP